MSPFNEPQVATWGLSRVIKGDAHPLNSKIGLIPRNKDLLWNTRYLNPDIPPHVILWAEILTQLESLSPHFQEFLTRPTIRRFPDGTAYIPEKADVFLMYDQDEFNRFAGGGPDSRGYIIPPAELLQIAAHNLLLAAGHL